VYPPHVALDPTNKKKEILRQYFQCVTDSKKKKNVKRSGGGNYKKEKKKQSLRGIIKFQYYLHQRS